MKKMVAWILLLILGNVLWLSLDKNPPAWDQAAHLKGVLLVKQFIEGSFNGGFVDLIHSFWGYPPLIYFLGGVVGAKYLNTFFLILGVIGVYKLANKKILPAILFSLFPVIYDISRNMLLDLALTVWVVWGLYFWMKKNDGKWLLMLILASLTKLNGFIYFVPMVVISVVERFKEKNFWKKAILGIFIYGVAVGWWWLINWTNIYQYLTGLAGQGEVATDPMNLSSWQTWIHYFKLFFLNQLGPITALIFLIISKKENKKMWWWLGAIYVIFTIIKNKDFRFTMPMLPVIAVYFGWGLSELKKKWLIGLVLGWMLFNYIENSFNWPIKKPIVVSTPTFLLGDINWINFSDYPVREYRQSIWPNEKILADLPNERTMLLVVMNIAELNDNTLGLYKLMAAKNNLEIHGIDKWGKMEFEYVLVPGIETESAPFYDTQLQIRKEAIKNIWENMEKYQEIGKYDLPNGGIVYLLKTSVSSF